MSAWDVANEIDLAREMLARNGFKVTTARGYNRETLCLETATKNAHGFADDIVLEQFNSWREVVVFMSGWEKRAMVYIMKAKL